jgi:predicted oxidoreductase (fatty acid repression mutant protein)
LTTVYEKTYILLKEYNMAVDFGTAIKMRRTVYGLGNGSTLSDGEIEKLLGDALLHSPSAFNSQSGRIVLLLGKNHEEFWAATKEILRPLSPPAAFGKTEEKMAAFGAAHGTVLFFEDQAVVSGLQEKFPLYKDNFPIWSGNSTGMLQFVVWTSLATAGMGASLQHYNPLVDEWVRKKTGAPVTWKLTAEMPFGLPLAEPGPKDFLPLEGRLKVLR